MAFDLANYLLDNVVRLRRHNWGGGNTEMLAQELYTYINGIRRSVSQTSTTDRDGNPITIPTIDLPTFNPTPFDFAFPNSPIINPPTPIRGEPGEPGQPGQPGQPVNPNDPQDPNIDPPNNDRPISITEETRWFRYIFPGKVLARDGTTITVRIYVNGIAAYEGNVGPFATNETEEQFRRDVEAQVTAAIDPDGLAENAEALAACIPINSWTWVAQFVLVTIIRTVIDGGQTNEEVTTEEPEYLINAPENATGWAIVSPEGIPEMGEDDIPTSGTAIMKLFENSTWQNGPEITLYNTAGEVAGDARVQFKSIAGRFFVDVEKC